MWTQQYIYNVYTSDIFKYIVKALGGDMSSRYVEILHPAKEDDRTGADIASDVIERCGLKVVG